VADPGVAVAVAVAGQPRRESPHRHSKTALHPTELKGSRNRWRRRKVRRLLAMYGYPPDLSEDATQLVLKQAELSTEYAK